MNLQRFMELRTCSDLEWFASRDEVLNELFSAWEWGTECYRSMVDDKIRSDQEISN